MMLMASCHDVVIENCVILPGVGDELSLLKRCAAYLCGDAFPHPGLELRRIREEFLGRALLHVVWPPGFDPAQPQAGAAQGE